MCSEEIKNVLVLGTSTFRVSQFCKLFEAYLSYDSYEDVLQWQPNLNEDDADGIERSIISVNKLRLICTPNLEGSDISKQILWMLSNFEENQSLSAIIILTNSSQVDGIHLRKLRHLFRNLEQISDNVVYVNALENDFYKYEQIMKEQFAMIKKNVFNFNQNIFFNAENWLNGVNFCGNIKNYIIGNDKNRGLETVCVDSKISEELVVNLINNLTGLLILIYGRWTDLQISVDEFKRNMTVCRGCIPKMFKIRGTTWKYNFKKMIQSPKICHSSCSCPGANTNFAKCVVFDAMSKTCRQCKCKTEFHSRNYFKTSIATTGINQQQLNQEKQVVINVLAVFYVYKTQNQGEFNFEDTLKTVLHLKEAESKIIFDDFQKEFNGKVKELLSTSQAITNKDVVVCVNSLYAIKESTKIIPKFIEEIFPKDQFEIWCEFKQCV